MGNEKIRNKADSVSEEEIEVFKDLWSYKLRENHPQHILNGHRRVKDLGIHPEVLDNVIDEGREGPGKDPENVSRLKADTAATLYLIEPKYHARDIQTEFQNIESPPARQRDLKNYGLITEDMTITKDGHRTFRIAESLMNYVKDVGDQGDERSTGQKDLEKILGEFQTLKDLEDSLESFEGASISEYEDRGDKIWLNSYGGLAEVKAPEDADKVIYTPDNGGVVPKARVELYISITDDGVETFAP